MGIVNNTDYVEYIKPEEEQVVNENTTNETKKEE